AGARARLPARHGCGGRRGLRTRAQLVGQRLVAAGAGPSDRVAVVEPVAELGIRAELEQREDRLALPALGSEVDRRHALAVRRAAEGASPVRVGPELDEPPDRGDSAV